jgi:hypothetical protein
MRLASPVTEMQTETPAPPVVRRAHVEVLRIYDVADDIDLQRVESLLAGRQNFARIRLARVEPKAIAFGDPPVVTDLVAPALDVLGIRCEVRASARIHSFGVVSVSLEVWLPRPLPWAEWQSFAYEAEREAAGLPFWRASLDSLLEGLRPALVDPTPVRLEEDYAIVTVRELEPPLSAAALQRAVDLVPLLTHERRPLSDAARAEVMKHAHSYYTDDLAVLTWDRAFVLEPSPDDDVSDVLEVVNAQLLELRFYDAMLDTELPRVYRQAAAVRGRRAILQGEYSRTAHQMRALVAEITQITEKVDNAIKVTEDVYLARVYSSALELFRVRFWADSIDRKLALIRDTYTALYDEAMATRAEFLETAIVLLIVLEIVLAFALGH